MERLTLIFGGSFNPVHHAHLICARAAMEHLAADSLTLIPTAQPPHKPVCQELASPTDRLRMCQIAIENDPCFYVDDIELQRGGTSYTIDTVRQLRARGAGQIHWLIGADMVAILPAWHQAEALLQEVTFDLLARPGWCFDWLTLPPPFRVLQSRIVPAPLLEISATQIRHRVAADLPIDYLTPPSVCRYIAEHRLYQHAQPL